MHGNCLKHEKASVTSVPTESSKSTLTQDHAFHSGGGLGRNELLGSYHIPVRDQDLQCDNA